MRQTYACRSVIENFSNTPAAVQEFQSLDTFNIKLCVKKIKPRHYVEITLVISSGVLKGLNMLPSCFCLSLRLWLLTEGIYAIVLPQEVMKRCNASRSVAHAASREPRDSGQVDLISAYLSRRQKWPFNWPYMRLQQKFSSYTKPK